MRTIYKYRLPRDGQTITIAEYIIEVLHIGTQDGWPMLWAVVDTDKVQETEVVAWGTGWPLPDDVYFETDYWGTAADGAGYVWHYFAATRSSDRWTEDATFKYVNPADKVAALETTAQPYSPYTISISCDGNTAIDNLMCSDKAAYDPTISTACTGTISTNVYSNDVKIDFDKLIGMVEKYVGSSNTATNASVR